MQKPVLFSVYIAKYYELIHREWQNVWQNDNIINYEENQLQMYIQYLELFGFNKGLLEQARQINSMLRHQSIYYNPNCNVEEEFFKFFDKSDFKTKNP